MVTIVENNWMILIQLLKEIADEKGITQKEISEATGYRQPHISRLFSLTHTPGLDVFLNVAKAVGVNFFIEDQDSQTDLNLCFERAMTALGRRSLEGPSNN